MKKRMMFLGLVGAAALTGCASNDQITTSCCYQGTATPARLTGLPLTLSNGETMPVEAALEGFRPMPAFGGPRYPVREVDLRYVTQRGVKEIFHSYDANRNNALEQPEITVLYVREAALGMGVPVDYVGGSQPLGAIDTAPADIMGMVSFVNSNKGRMQQQARLVFDEMDTQAYLVRILNAGGPDPRRPPL